MALSESLFLFELVVEEVQGCTECKNYYMTCNLADLFALSLKESNEKVASPKKKKVRSKAKLTCARKNSPTKSKPELTFPVTKSVLFSSNIYTLMIYMKTYPLELNLISRNKSKKKLGSTQIPWDHSYLQYLHSLRDQENIPPITKSGEYYIINEPTNKCVSRIKLKTRICYLNRKTPVEFRSLSENNMNVFSYSGVQSTSKGFHYQFVPKNEDGKGSNLQTTVIQFGKPIPKNTGKIQDMNDDKNKGDAKESNEAQNTTITDQERSAAKVCKLLTSPSNDIKAVDMFSRPEIPKRNQVYVVGYCTVHNDFTQKSGRASSASSKSSMKETSEDEADQKKKYKMRICASDCKLKGSTSAYSINIPDEAAHLISVGKCNDVSCEHRQQRPDPELPDDRILLDLSNLRRSCCQFTQQEVVGEVEAKIKIGDLPCECSCVCRFGATMTTYCGVCGGYEKIGEMADKSKPSPAMSYPCPVFHKLIDAKKLKNYSTSGSDSKSNATSQRSLKQPSKSNALSQDKKGTKQNDKKSNEPERAPKKTKKGKVKDERFIFNYGYQAPRIGHMHCAQPCTGTLGSVPKKMGWLWTAEDIPGMKFRPNWKPGATHKFVVRMLKMAKNPGEVMMKKKKKDSSKKKKNDKRPLLVVHKKDGEYDVTMETMKIYPKQRLLNQYPYEDKPVLTYTIGRTELENRVRQKKKDRAKRRLERAQRQFIQSAFRDMCHEICLKTYQQALGILPDAEKDECACYPAHPDAEALGIDRSCSCSEDTIIDSDTDSDEWIVEFTPPNATFDPKFKAKKVVKVDNGSQYTYMDYRVKLMDRYGNPVPRFFKGPDGTTQCSDLGGFWSPDKQWLEINVDGYVAPDGRWAPNQFIGPNGETVDAEIGKFQTTNGRWLVVGIDGYIDANGRWRSHPRPRGSAQTPNKAGKGSMQSKPKGKDAYAGKDAAGKKEALGKKDAKKGKNADRTPDMAWSCFGDVSPLQLSEMGIVGHGYDKKLLLTTLKTLVAKGQKVKIPEPPLVPRSTRSRKLKVKYDIGPDGKESRSFFSDSTRCHHPTPSQKGIITDERGRKSYFRLKKKPDYNEMNTVRRHVIVQSIMNPAFPKELYPTVHTG